MICFNLGLHFGFTSLGDQVGMLLPAAFLKTGDVEDSPLYPQAGGVAIALGTMFTLGVFATRAEPALNVVGETVEKLTRGSFSKNMLVYSVCVGPSPLCLGFAGRAALTDTAAQAWGSA